MILNFRIQQFGGAEESHVDISSVSCVHCPLCGVVTNSAIGHFKKKITQAACAYRRLSYVLILPVV